MLYNYFEQNNEIFNNDLEENNVELDKISFKSSKVDIKIKFMDKLNIQWIYNNAFSTINKELAISRIYYIEDNIYIMKFYLNNKLFKKIKVKNDIYSLVVNKTVNFINIPF